MGRCLRENPQVWNCGSIAGPDTSQIAAEATGSVMKARLPERSNVARPRSPVPVQREMERERSPLVSNTRPSGGGFSRHLGLPIRCVLG
jgi:hypothetical protein